MKTKKLHNNKPSERILEHFKGRSEVDVREIKEYYKITVPGINDNAVYARIFQLKRKGLIAVVGGDRYTFSPKPVWQPTIFQDAKKVEQLIIKQFVHGDFLIWDTSWLNEFTNLQAFRKLIIIEPEEIIAESVFFFLKERKFKELYFKPDAKIIELYTGNSQLTFIIKALITKSPFHKFNDHLPSIEKMLVDLFCEKELFVSFQGEELENIWLNVFKKYQVNKSTLINYSRRRGKNNEIADYMKNINLH
jgi:hypothetical protein